MSGPDSVDLLPSSLVQGLLGTLDVMSREWQLSPDAWEAVDDLVARAEEAIRAGDADGLARTTRLLQLRSPWRANDAGRGATEGQPPRTRERTKRIVHTLKPPQPPATTGKPTSGSSTGR